MSERPSDPSRADKAYDARAIEQIVTRLRDRCRVVEYDKAPNLIDDALEACEIIEQLCATHSAGTRILAPHHPDMAVRQFYRDWLIACNGKTCEEDAYLAGFRKANEIEFAQSASVAFSELEMDNLRSNIIGAITNLWTDEAQRRIVREKVDALFTNAYRYAFLRAHFWKPILGACFGRYMIAEEKDARLLDYHVDRATSRTTDSRGVDNVR